MTQDLDPHSLQPGDHASFRGVDRRVVFGTVESSNERTVCLNVKGHRHYVPYSIIEPSPYNKPRTP